MFVLTIDQRGSRRDVDRVPTLLSQLSVGERVLRGFERTVGDEIQGVLPDAAPVVELALTVLRTGGWSVGIGAGPVDEPLPLEARAGTGTAFVLARRAVERAKSRQRPVPVAVEGRRADRAADAEAVLTLVAAVAARRTEGGWAAVDAWRATDGRGTQEEIAGRLGVSQQAVSQRLAAALWDEEWAVRPVLARLLEEAQG